MLAYQRLKRFGYSRFPHIVLHKFIVVCTSNYKEFVKLKTVEAEKPTHPLKYGINI